MPTLWTSKGLHDDPHELVTCAEHSSSLTRQTLDLEYLSLLGIYHVGYD